MARGPAAILQKRRRSKKGAVRCKGSQLSKQKKPTKIPATVSTTPALSTAPEPAALARPLADVPLDIFYTITDLLPNPSLLSLALTNQRFHDILSESLYQRFKKSITHSKDPRFGVEGIGPMRWAARHGKAELLERLMKETQVVDNPERELSLLLALAAQSGDGDTVLLVLNNTHEMGVKTRGLPLHGCSNELVFRILADEATRRLKALGFG